MSLSANEEAQLVAQIGGGAILPVGTASVLTPPYAQTFDRRLAISAASAPTSGTLTMTGIWLPAGKVVTGISFVSGATGETGGTHLWFALYRQDLVLMAQSTDDTGATSFAASTCLRKALTAAQTCPYTGLYYLGFLCTHSAGGIPTLLNAAAAVTTGNGAEANNRMLPILAATSSTGQLGTAPNPAGALTAIAASYYAFVD
jgi:hypothetical protein